MVMSFRYKAIKRPDGRTIKTPSIPINLIGNSGIKIEAMALIDSGADLSIIPQDIAELLNLNLKEGKDKSRGIGGEVEVINTTMQINVKKVHEDYMLRIPVQVILGDNKIPILLGREGFYNEFEITLYQSEERISLKKLNVPSYQ